MKNPFLLLVVFYIVCFSLTAQEVEEYNRLTKFTAASILYTQYSTNDFDSEFLKGNVTTSELKATLQYPLEIKKSGLKIINGLNLILLSPKVEEEVNAIEINRNFYTIAYNLGLIKTIGKKHWRIVTILKPTFASDFHEAFSSEDFLFQASAFTIKRVNKFWEFGFGLSLNTRFGNEQLLPLLYYSSKKNQLETNIFIPSYIQQFYCFEKSKIGISLAVDMNNYNFDNTVIPNLDLDKLIYLRLNIGPMYERLLMKNIYANMQGGITIMNRHMWNDQNKETVLELSPEDKFFFRVGLKLLK